MAQGKRGRPRLQKPGVDLGTPELQRHRQDSGTAEALDIFLQHQMIDEEQHWCGMHLRWLHTLKHGAPGANITDILGSIYGSFTAAASPQWRAEREEEYRQALEALADPQIRRTVCRIAIYNESSCMRGRRQEQELLSQGLEILRKHWRR